MRNLKIDEKMAQVLMQVFDSALKYGGMNMVDNVTYVRQHITTDEPTPVMEVPQA